MRPQTEIYPGTPAAIGSVRQSTLSGRSQDRPMPLPPLAIQMFGPFRGTVRGEPLPRLRTRSVEWLLALLTLPHGRAVQRSWPAGTLWPESSESQALKNLRNDLVELCKALGPESHRLQSPARDTLTLDLAGAVVDLVQFDAAIHAGDEESLRAAVELYTGPLLEGCVEEWASASGRCGSSSTWPRWRPWPMRPPAGATTMRQFDICAGPRRSTPCATRCPGG